MFQDKEQEKFFELVRAGLFLGKEARILVHGIVVDWDEIYRLAEEQSVVGQVAAGIDSLPVTERPPQAVVLQFIGSTLQIEQQNKELNAYLAKLIGLLRKNDVYAILVKGQGIAQCYEKPLWRASGDIDLLLDAKNYKKAKELLKPLATSVDKEYTYLKHLGMTIDGWVVELHGTFLSRLSNRIDREIENIQDCVFKNNEVRVWKNGDSNVYLPSVDNDVFFLFTHILRHYFFEGIGLRQICDWCRLLWRYRAELDLRLLESRIRRMGLMTEWKAFAAYVVDYLGMPEEAMPLYSPDGRWKKKAERINCFVIKVGNFGHKYRRNYEGKSYLVRKFISFMGRLSDMLRHFATFPKDSIVFLGGVVRSGLYAAVRGE